MSFGELQNSLEANEQRVVDRKNSERAVEQALQAKTGQSSKGRGGWNMRGRERFRGRRNGDKNSDFVSQEHSSNSGCDRKEGT